MRLAFVILLASAVAATASGARAGELELVALGVHGREGELVLAVYAKENAARFPDPDSVISGIRVSLAHVEDSAGGVRVRIAGLLPGEYAVSAFHDTDANRILTRNFLGIPTEAFAFSQDARGRFGPPSFDAASFQVSNESITVQLHLSLP